MIDKNVGSPRGSTREFVDEIETNLVRYSELDYIEAGFRRQNRPA